MVGSSCLVNYRQVATIVNRLTETNIWTLVCIIQRRFNVYILDETLFFQVGHVVWHPAAENVLASVGFDRKIIIWNTATGDMLFTLEDFHSDIIYSMSWNYNGSLIATTCKDKKLRILDPRKEDKLLAVSELWLYPPGDWGFLLPYFVFVHDFHIHTFCINTHIPHSQEGNCHQGTKPARVVFCGTTNKLFTTGFSRMSERQYAVWNAVSISTYSGACV